MATIPLIDAHLHLWDPRRFNYPWLREFPRLHRPYLLEDYLDSDNDFTIQGMVFVQCECDPLQARLETDWVLALACKEPRLRAVVAWAPVETGERVRENIESLVGSPLVKGVRRIIQYESDPEFCLHPSFIQGVRLISEYNLSFDICVNHTQLENVIRLVASCPDVRFVLDHIGKPGIRHGALEPWKTNIGRLAQFPNLWCKISGLVAEADCDHWKEADLRPYIDHVVECFGFDRMLYGSDWPVVLLASELPRWVTCLNQSVEQCSVDEKRKLFHDNAVAFYRIDESAGVVRSPKSEHRANRVTIG